MKNLITVLAMLLLCSCAPQSSNSSSSGNAPSAPTSPGTPVVPTTPAPLPPAVHAGPDSVSLSNNSSDSSDPAFASAYVIIAAAGITTTPGTTIVGNIAVSPIAASSMTGFALSRGSSGQFSTSTLVSGNVYAANYAAPTPSNLSLAGASWRSAYNDAAGRTNPDFVNLNAGNLSGMTLLPGLYKFNSGLLITRDVTLSGGPDDVFILQVSGTINLATGTHILLSGGVQAKNVIYQVSGAVTLGVDSHFEGIILGNTNVAVKTRCSVNGRIFAGTAVTLDNNLITQK